MVASFSFRTNMDHVIEVTRFAIFHGIQNMKSNNCLSVPELSISSKIHTLKETTKNPN